MRCMGCGHENPEGAEWCAQCRRPLMATQGPVVVPPPAAQPPPPFPAAPPPPAVPTVQQRPSISRTAVWVAVITGALLLLCLGFVAYQLSGPVRARFHLAKAMQLERSGRTEEALAAYEKAVQEAPNDAMVRLYLASALGRAERREEAVAEYEEALRLDPNNMEAWVALGIAAYEIGDLKKSVEAYRKAIELDDSRSIAHNNLAYVLYDQDEVDEAVSEWEQAIELLPTSDVDRQGRADCWAGLAIGYLAQGKRQEAIEAYRRAVSINPHYIDTKWMAREAFWSPKAIEAAEQLIPKVKVKPAPRSADELPTV